MPIRPELLDELLKECTTLEDLTVRTIVVKKLRKSLRSSVFLAPKTLFQNGINIPHP
jgi:hypothetical protein